MCISKINIFISNSNECESAYLNDCTRNTVGAIFCNEIRRRKIVEWKLIFLRFDIGVSVASHSHNSPPVVQTNTIASIGDIFTTHLSHCQLYDVLALHLHEHDVCRREILAINGTPCRADQRNMRWQRRIIDWFCVSRHEYWMADESVISTLPNARLSVRLCVIYDYTIAAWLLQVGSWILIYANNLNVISYFLRRLLLRTLPGDAFGVRRQMHLHATMFVYRVRKREKEKERERMLNTIFVASYI